MNKNSGLFSKVGKTRIVPIGYKILLIFICLILLSNFVTNYISLKLTQRQLINLNNTIMVAQLKELFANATNQFQIFLYTNSKDEYIESMEKVAQAGFSNPNSVALSVKIDGNMGFAASNNESALWTRFSDLDALVEMNNKLADGTSEGSINFKGFDGGEYFGVYKYHDKWECYFIRAEKRSEISEHNLKIFLYSSFFIIGLTLIFIVIGYVVLGKEFSTLKSFTTDLIRMQKNKSLELIDLSKASNDDITYMAASFNSLSVQVNNLLGTFQKFVSKDIVEKAYAGKAVGLEGNQEELTMLFSDVKSFTYRTETLGNDIIQVLNVHYNRVIHKIHENGGIVGSIVGDAILAVYGTRKSETAKSYNAICSAWDITRATANLREAMIKRRKEIEKTRPLTESEERVFKAVVVDVGVGVDGGKVFYGTIGRNDISNSRQSHMANTVIGDTVNSASRLEGLTRIYRLPVIVSEYVKDEVLKESSRFEFFEIDTVQVKGKTEGKKIYFPLDAEESESDLRAKFVAFEEGLQAYYAGDWKNARKMLKEVDLDATQVFLERMGLKNAPEDWSGIWTMTTK